MPADTHDGAYDAFEYSVTLDGRTVAGFSETSGLSSDGMAWRLIEGIERVARKIWGVQKRTTLTLKRGVTGSADFWNWMRQVQGPGARGTAKDLVGTMHDERRRPIRKWCIVRARCRRIVGPAIDSKGNFTAIESLEVTCDAVRRT